LGAADQAVLSVAGINQELRQLSGFSRAGFTRDNDDLVLLDGTYNFCSPGMDREFLTVAGVQNAVCWHDGRWHHSITPPPDRNLLFSYTASKSSICNEWLNGLK
jgi:hypothetical protein